MNMLKKLASFAILTVFSVSPAFSYGGGGGGGSSYVSPELTPGFSAISPAKNSTLTSAQNISFEVSANAAEDSIVVLVNGEEVEVSITEKEDGTFVVTAPMGNLEDGTALISLEASAAVSSSYKRTYIFPVVIGEGSENTLPSTPEEEKEVANQCDADEVNGDGTYSSDKTYSDISGDSNEEYIIKLTEMCVFHGTEGSETFEPSKAFDRAAATKTVIKAFGYQYAAQVSTNPFGDVEASQWYAPYVASAKSAGIIRGYGNGSFGPAHNMNIAEGLAIVARASGTDVSGYATGSTEWFASYMAWGTEKGLIDSSTQANGTLTRGSLARMISVL